MIYTQIEKSLTEAGYKLSFGTSPLKGMRFSNGDKHAFVFLKVEDGKIKGHEVAYYD